jgi:hypothetical protein
MFGSANRFTDSPFGNEVNGGKRLLAGNRRSAHVIIQPAEALKYWIEGRLPHTLSVSIIILRDHHG